MRIGVIGRTAYGTNLCDGQTVKTRVLVEELKIKYPNVRVDLADTYLWKKNTVLLLFQILSCMVMDDVIFVLLSVNGRRVIFPIITFFNAIFRKTIIHDCIGGKIAKDAKINVRLVKEMNRFTVNYVESNSLVQELQEAGVHNAEYLPNFKRLSILNASQIKNSHGNRKFCTFSRVCHDKGITDAINAVCELNRCNKGKRVFLDIYGPIEKEYEGQFYKMIESTQGCVLYKGISDPKESVNILKDYYVLLFPSVFEGEGFPGTLIDALSSGLPVIATDWHLNSEIIEHGRTGYIYAHNDKDKLKEWIMYSINNPQEIFKMRFECIKEAEKYAPYRIMDIIDQKIRHC